MSVATYTQAQQRLLARCGIDAESRFVDVPASAAERTFSSLVSSRR